MSKHSKFLSISEFCEQNGFKTYKFYKILSRYPELARKMKTSSAGEHMLDEEAMRTAKAILRKEKTEDRRKRSAADAANEINILVAQIDELRKEVGKVRCENERLKKYISREKKKRRIKSEPLIQPSVKIAAAVFKTLGRDYLPDDEKRIAKYLESCEDFKIFMNSKAETEEW